MRIERAIYNTLLPVAEWAARCAAPFSDKIAEGLKDREGFRDRWRAGAERINHDAPLVWFHVSSVGEFEQAKPVMSLLAERLGTELQIALTFYSPSGMNYYKRFDRSRRIGAIAFLDYLPIDTAGNARFCLDALRPDMIVYVKFDLWPNLILEAAERAIPQVLISGTLSPGSRRLSRISRGFYGQLYSELDIIAAISAEDAERFRASSRGPVRIVVAGDTRFDQVCRRVDSASAEPPGTLAEAERSWIIAGSTWPKDEAVVVSGYRALRRAHAGMGLVLVPHEPSPERLSAIDRTLTAAELPYRLLSSIRGTVPLEIDVVVADGVGYLAELYRSGMIAYVGGSFTTGVHNVMEPAVLGLPVLFGPRIDNSYEALRLVDLGAAAIVRTGADFAREAGAMLADPQLRGRRGTAAVHFIRNHCGAASRCVDLMEILLAEKR